MDMKLKEVSGVDIRQVFNRRPEVASLTLATDMYKKKEKIKDMKISFFKNFIWFISLILFLFFSSFFLVSITYFNHKNEVITYENIEIYKTNEIQNFNAYFENNDLYIIICLNETKDDFFLLDYAYYYFF